MNEKGFTLLECIVSLYVVSMAILLLSGVVLMMKGDTFQSYKSEDENSIFNLRRIYMLSEEQRLDGDMLAFRYLNKEMYFLYQDNKLVLKEGYQVYFREVEAAYFTETGDCIYVVYKHKQKKEEKRIIGC